MNSHRDHGRIFTCVGTPGRRIICWRLCSFLKLPPCDMFQGECSYLLSAPVCIALLIVCSHVPQCAPGETDGSREALMLWSNLGLRLQSPGGQASRCCHCSIRKKRGTLFWQWWAFIINILSSYTGDEGGNEFTNKKQGVVLKCAERWRHWVSKQWPKRLH